METILLHPKNKVQLTLIKNLAKQMGMSFETKSDGQQQYNPEFVAKMEKSKQDFEEGRFKAIKTEDLWK